jgi:pimeloyl-ACP methyl ester carboxylesterase
MEQPEAAETACAVKTESLSHEHDENKRYKGYTMINPLICMIKRPIMRRRNAKKLAAPGHEYSESRYVSLNGVEQWITIRGEKASNPCILMVHGGPGATYTLFSPLLVDWEAHFTLIQWDQIGSGKTFQKNGAVEPLSFDRISCDGIALAHYLREYLGCKKIILMGSSAGSLIGLKMIRKAPECFLAYIGVNQNTPERVFFTRPCGNTPGNTTKRRCDFLKR